MSKRQKRSDSAVEKTGLCRAAGEEGYERRMEVMEDLGEAV
jgi:hypothetical protein